MKYLYLALAVFSAFAGIYWAGYKAGRDGIQNKQLKVEKAAAEDARQGVAETITEYDKILGDLERGDAGLVAHVISSAIDRVPSPPDKK